MSDFDKTIVPSSSFQNGAGLPDGTPAKLAGVREVPAYKGVWIRNVSANAAALIWIGYKSSAPVLSIVKDQMIFLEIRDVWNIKIVGTGISPAYNYLCY